MGKSPSAIIRSGITVCNDASIVANALEAEGRHCDARTVRRLVTAHADAVRQLKKLREQQ